MWWGEPASAVGELFSGGRSRAGDGRVVQGPTPNEASHSASRSHTSPR
jgi:hypothetical protein